MSSARSPVSPRLPTLEQATDSVRDRPPANTTATELREKKRPATVHQRFDVHMG